MFSTFWSVLKVFMFIIRKQQEQDGTWRKSEQFKVCMNSLKFTDSWVIIEIE